MSENHQSAAHKFVAKTLNTSDTTSIVVNTAGEVVSRLRMGAKLQRAWFEMERRPHAAPLAQDLLSEHQYRELDHGDSRMKVSSKETENA
jgi:hypothetical protein